MQVLLVIAALSCCIATTALVADVILRVVLRMSFGRAGATRPFLPGRVESYAPPVGVWLRDRL